MFHNHLVVDTLLAVFPFGSQQFVELRERFWLDVIGEAAAAGLPGVIFTFAPENTVRPGFPERLSERLSRLNSVVSFVSLTAPEPVIEERIASESRRAQSKHARKRPREGETYSPASRLVLQRSTPLDGPSTCNG